MTSNIHDDVFACACVWINLLRASWNITDSCLLIHTCSYCIFSGNVFYFVGLISRIPLVATTEPYHRNEMKWNEKSVKEHTHTHTFCKESALDRIIGWCCCCFCITIVYLERGENYRSKKAKKESRTNIPLWHIGYMHRTYVSHGLFSFIRCAFFSLARLLSFCCSLNVIFLHCSSSYESICILHGVLSMNAARVSPTLLLFRSVCVYFIVDMCFHNVAQREPANHKIMRMCYIFSSFASHHSDWNHRPRRCRCVRVCVFCLLSLFRCQS